MHNSICTQRNNIFLGERLDAVSNRLQNSQRTNAIRAKTILNAPQSLALQDRSQSKDAGESRDDGNDT